MRFKPSNWSPAKLLGTEHGLVQNLPKLFYINYSYTDARIILVKFSIGQGLIYKAIPICPTTNCFSRGGGKNVQCIFTFTWAFTRSTLTKLGRFISNFTRSGVTVIIPITCPILWYAYGLIIRTRQSTTLKINIWISSFHYNIFESFI